MVVQRKQVLLRRDHHRLLQGPPLRGALPQAQRLHRPRRRLLELPGLHRRRRPLRAPRFRHHWRQGHGRQGGRRVPRPRRREDLMNYNYGIIGKGINQDLLSYPELLEQNATIAFEAAIWRWMTPVKRRQPSAHDVFVGNWKLETNQE